MADRASVEAQDAAHWKDPKFRHFRDELDSALQQFERAQEWADLIRYLQRLQRVLTKYSQLPIIPDKILVAKRLFQCLNSSLPSGVHLTTLQTYELIFSRIGSARLARDLAFYTEGIFTLYRHASYQVKPVLLDLFERHFVTLGPAVVPCLPGLVLALLTAMEDMGSEYHSRAVRLLDQLASEAPIEPFMSAVWGCLLRNATVRLQALNYINLRFPTAAPNIASPSPTQSTGGAACSSAGPAGAGGAADSTPGGEVGERLNVSRRAFCPDAQGTVLRSLVVALQQGDTLVRRTALELLVTHFPLPASPFTEGVATGDCGLSGKVMDAAGLWLVSPSKARSAPEQGEEHGQAGVALGPTTPALQINAVSGENDDDALFSVDDFISLLRVALTLLPLREWALSRRVLLWLFRSPPPHVSSGIDVALPPDAVPILLGAAKQLFTAAAAPPPPPATAPDDYDDPLAPRAEAAPLSPSPFRTLVHVLDVPALAKAIADDDAILLAALSAAAVTPSFSEDSSRFFSHERLPQRALWRACTRALLSLEPQHPATGGSVHKATRCNSVPSTRKGKDTLSDGGKMRLPAGMVEGSVTSFAPRSSTAGTDCAEGSEFSTCSDRQDGTNSTGSMSVRRGPLDRAAPSHNDPSQQLAQPQLELLDVSAAMLSRLPEPSLLQPLGSTGGPRGASASELIGSGSAIERATPVPRPVCTPSDGSTPCQASQIDAIPTTPREPDCPPSLPRGVAELAGMAAASCRVASAAAGASNDALLLGCLHLQHNLLVHLFDKCRHAANLETSRAIDTAPFPGTPKATDGTPGSLAPAPAPAGGSASVSPSFAEAPSVPAAHRDPPASPPHASTTAAAPLQPAPIMIDNVLASLLRPYSLVFSQLVRAASRRGSAATQSNPNYGSGGDGADDAVVTDELEPTLNAAEPTRRERRNRLEAEQRTSQRSNDDTTLLCALSLSVRLLLMILRVESPCDPIPWRGAGGVLAYTSGRSGRCGGNAGIGWAKGGAHGAWRAHGISAVPAVVSSVLGTHNLSSYAASAAAQSPFSFGLGRALHSTLASPPVLWSKLADDIYLNLVGSPTAGPLALADARAVAGEMATAAIGAAAAAVSVAEGAEAARAVAATALSATSDLPLWLSALVEGCGSASFAVLATCAPGLALAIQAGKLDTSTTHRAPTATMSGSSDFKVAHVSRPLQPPLGTPRAVSIMSCVWHFLGSDDGSTQHAAALLWTRLQAVWPDACAAVVAARMRAAARAYEEAAGKGGVGSDGVGFGALVRGSTEGVSRDATSALGRRRRGWVGRRIVGGANNATSALTIQPTTGGPPLHPQEEAEGDEDGEDDGEWTETAAEDSGNLYATYAGGVSPSGNSDARRDRDARPSGVARDRSRRIGLASDALAREVARFSLLWRASLLAAPQRSQLSPGGGVGDAGPALSIITSQASMDVEAGTTTFPVMYSNTRPGTSCGELDGRRVSGADAGDDPGRASAPHADVAGGDELQLPAATSWDTSRGIVNARSTLLPGDWAISAGEGGGGPAGVGLLLALDTLQHPSAAVRATAGRWLASASSFPPPLLTPLLAMLVGPRCTPRVRLYALAKLRAVLAAAHDGFIAQLGGEPAPPHLLCACRTSMRSAPLAPAVLPSTGGSLLLLLAAGTLLQVLQPASQRHVSGNAGGTAPSQSPVGSPADTPLLKPAEMEPPFAQRDFDLDADTSTNWRELSGSASREPSGREQLSIDPIPTPFRERSTSGMPREASRRLRFGDSAQALATELMTSLLHGTPAHIGKPLSALLLQPVLRILRASVGSSVGRGAQSQLLALAYAALSHGRESDGREIGYPAGLLAELLVPTITAGLADTQSPVWAHWAGFGVACLVHCVSTRSADAATALTVALLTTLSELLLYQHASLPPQQLEALLVTLHHTHHYCVLGFEVPATSIVAPPPPPSRRTAQQAELSAAQLAMFQQLPSVLWALLHAWRAAPPNDAHSRQLALAPLALLASHCRRELLASVLYVWEQHCMGSAKVLVELDMGATGSAPGAPPHAATAPSIGMQAAMTELNHQTLDALPGSARPHGCDREYFPFAYSPKNAFVTIAYPNEAEGRARSYDMNHGGGVNEEALLELLSQLPDSTPNQIIGTAAEIVQQGRPGASPVRVPLHVSLRFLCRYVQTAQPVRSLAEAWPRLVALLRGGVAALPYAPVGLAVILWEWVQRMNEMGDASPLTKSRERHEAKDVAELLLRALASQLSRSARRPERAGGADRSPRDPDAPLLDLGPHCAGWDETDMGVLCLLGLERTMMPLLSALFPPKPSGREHAMELLVALLPAVMSPLETVVSGGAPRARTERLAHAALLVLLRVIAVPSTTRAWRKPVGRLFGSPGFFAGLSRRTLPLWARAVNAFLCLETPKVAISTLLAGKTGITAGWFASRAQEAEAQADLLRRLSFALWVGERNQYVGALQGMLIDRLVAAFKFGSTAGDSASSVRWVVQVGAMQCARVLAVRVAPENLTSLWPIAMAELQRVLLNPSAAQPALLLAACQLVDMLLTVLPDDFAPFGWMFVPRSGGTSSPPPYGPSASEFAALLAPLAALRPATRPSSPPTEAPPSSMAISISPTRPSGSGAITRPPLADLSFSRRPSGGSLLAPSPDGRRRPLLALRTLTDMSELAPFASRLHDHLTRCALETRGTEIDVPMIDLLLGCAFLSPLEAARAIRPHLAGLDEDDEPPRSQVIGVRRVV